jgi:predicted metalloenzyme YecM
MLKIAAVHRRSQEEVLSAKDLSHLLMRCMNYSYAKTWETSIEAEGKIHQ